MPESRHFALREAQLLALARSRYKQDLNTAERRILHDSCRPGPVPRPPADEPRVSLPSDFIRWIASDTEASALLDPNGLQICHVSFADPLDLSGCTVPFDLNFVDCEFEKDLTLTTATVATLVLRETKITGLLDATSLGCKYDFLATKLDCAQIVGLDRCRILGECSFTDSKLHAGLSMRRGTVGADVTMSGCNADVLNLEAASIGGNLRCVSCDFGSKGEQAFYAVVLAAATISGSVWFDDCRLKGQLAFIDAQIKRDLRISGGQIQGAKSMLLLDAAELGGTLALWFGFRTDSTVHMQGGSIGADVLCLPEQLTGLYLHHVRVGGDIRWFSTSETLRMVLDLSYTVLKTLYDNRAAWPSKGSLVLVGCVYTDLQLCTVNKTPEDDTFFDLRGTSATATSRIPWLELQSDEDLRLSQPWQQLAAVLQERGDIAGSKHVLYTYARIHNARLGIVPRAASLPYDLIQENPMRVVLPLSSLWIVGTIVFWRAARMRAMAPTERTAYERFSSNKNLPGYARFHPAIYALENLVPAVKLGQDGTWGPDPSDTGRRLPIWLRYSVLATVRWILIILGWLIALILAGAVTSQFKN